MTFRYRIESTGSSSARFGVCEVCKLPVSDVHYQVEEEQIADEDGGGWMYGGHTLFGHRECLEKQRRDA
jgi:hypothetical protein